MRRPGAASLDLAYVACGRYDGFWEFGLAPWDMAAGTLLISEAGGLVGDLRGNLWRIDLSGGSRTAWTVAYDGRPEFNATDAAGMAASSFPRSVASTRSRQA